MSEILRPHKTFPLISISWPVFISMACRLSGVSGKFLLSFYMAKMMPLEELGIYGLSFSFIMFAIVLLGGRLDYIVAREMSGGPHDTASSSLFTSLLYYCSNYTLALIPIFILALLVGGFSHLTLTTLVFALCIVESLANYFFTLTTALDRAALANFLFFIRSGLWAYLAVGIGYFFPPLRSTEFILLCWLVSAAFSLCLNLFLFSDLFKEFRRSNFHLPWLRSSLNQAFPIWIGSVGLSLGGYIDRFIMLKFLSLEEIGVATFYLSFTLSILNLVQSSTMNVKFASLSRLFKAGDIDLYDLNFRAASRQSFLLTAFILIVVSISIPVLLLFIDKPELSGNLTTLFLLLFSTLIRSQAESLYYALYIEHKDSAVWKGNLIFLLSSCGLNFILIPMLKLQGVGWAAILSAALLLFWRQYARSTELTARSAAP